VRDVIELCSRIEKAVSDFELTVSAEESASVGVSLGAASYPGAGVTFDEIIVAADKGMYSRKSTRKNSLSEAGSADVGPAAEDIGKNDPELSTESYVVELDETHIVSAAVN
ncbi:MAG: diguanylate cyclase domain-containing protein, partial [Candidatus Binatia bacterium]